MIRWSITNNVYKLNILKPLALFTIVVVTIVIRLHSKPLKSALYNIYGMKQQCRSRKFRSVPSLLSWLRRAGKWESSSIGVEARLLGSASLPTDSLPNHSFISGTRPRRQNQEPEPRAAKSHFDPPSSFLLRIPEWVLDTRRVISHLSISFDKKKKTKRQKEARHCMQWTAGMMDVVWSASPSFPFLSFALFGVVISWCWCIYLLKSRNCKVKLCRPNGLYRQWTNVETVLVLSPNRLDYDIAHLIIFVAERNVTIVLEIDVSSCPCTSLCTFHTVQVLYSRWITVGTRRRGKQHPAWRRKENG